MVGSGGKVAIGVAEMASGVTYPVTPGGHNELVSGYC
jgi:hypothetical protein